MHGNVAEWVLDSYNPETYILWGNSVKNPVMIGKKLYPRVVRGGSFKSNIDELRSAARGFSKEKWNIHIHVIIQHHIMRNLHHN